MEILEINSMEESLVAAMERLVRQLNPNIAPPTADKLRQIIESKNTRFFMAKEDGRWAGSLSLAIYDIPTGRKAIIEDVVVDDAFRGRGIGKALMARAIETAGEAGAKTISLTSNPARVAANKLYQKLGFTLYETNVYVLPL